MKVNIILADVLDATKFGSCRTDIIKKVSDVYHDFMNFANARLKPPAPHTFGVQFATAKPSPADTDLVVYFLPATFWSIITFAETGTKKQNLLADHWGFTTTGASGSKSEVVCKSADGCVLGSLVVHEILHAKTAKGNNTLHPTGGLGAAVVECGTVANNANRTDIMNTLTKKVPQWSGGWDILMSAKAQRDAGDPFWDQF
jgi:hypothetical protein